MTPPSSLVEEDAITQPRLRVLRGGDIERWTRRRRARRLAVWSLLLLVAAAAGYFLRGL